MLAGLMTTVFGIRLGVAAARTPASDRSRLRTVVQGFRIAVVGLAAMGIGIRSITGEIWILVVSLGIGGEELLESNFIIAVLKRDESTRPTTSRPARY